MPKDMLMPTALNTLRPVRLKPPLRAAKPATGLTKQALAKLRHDLPEGSRKRLLATAARDLATTVACDAVRKALAESGATLRQLQGEYGLEPSTISRVATGTSVPTVTTLAKLALALDRELKIAIE